MRSLLTGLIGITLASAAACSNTTYSAPPPLKKTALPSGAALRPFDAVNNPTRAAPQGIAAGPGGSAFIALTNLDPSYSPGGPGLLVRLQPETGAQVVISLGGADDHACTNSGVVKNDNGLLVAVCSGGFSGTGGRLVVEVNPQTNAVIRSQTPPAGFQPSSVAVAASKVWVGDFSLPRLYSLSRSDFSIADGADATHKPIDLPCSGAYSYVADLLVVGGSLFALCGATDGIIVRLDAATGAVKDSAGVGGQPVAMALTGDGRIAVTNSTSDQLSLVTPGTTLTAQVNAVPFSKSATLSDVKARGQFLYTVTSGTNAVQKIDLAAKDQTHLIVAEQPTGAGSSPYGILPLDDNQAVVTNNLTGEVVGVNFAAATSTP
jgi:hypothetical protein